MTFYALGKSQSYILNVLQHLVIKKGVDINQVDMVIT